MGANQTHRGTLSLAAAIVALAVPALAVANPRALPSTYPYATLPKGSVEAELYVDLDPVKVLSTETGAPTFFVATELQAKLEIGLTDHLEPGLYATAVPTAGD